MDAGAADSARRATLAGVVFCDLPLGAEGDSGRGQPHCWERTMALRGRERRTHRGR